MNQFDPGFDVPLNAKEVQHLLGINEAPNAPRIVGAQRILVTGAGGSIGRDFVVRLLSRGHSVVVLDRSEKNLFFLEQLCREAGVTMPESWVVADLGDYINVQSILHRGNFSTVIHAAAYKHVGMMELNEEECRRNNVDHSLALFEAASTAGVARFVFLSTDKAVNASSVMGQSKADAERLLSRLASGGKVHLVTVRLPNVLGSDGSVVQIFRRQALRGQSLTLTHEDASRIFISSQRACDTLEAAMECGDSRVLIPEGCTTLKIKTLGERAHALWSQGNALKFEITGLVAGEKLRENLVGDNEEKVAGPETRVATIRPVK